MLKRTTESARIPQGNVLVFVIGSLTSAQFHRAQVCGAEFSPLMPRVFVGMTRSGPAASGALSSGEGGRSCRGNH